MLLNLSLLCPVFLCYSGVESPTHEIRADAAPSAHSAKSIIITLANKHTFDRPVEILLHPSGMVPHEGLCCPYGRHLVRARIGVCGKWVKRPETYPQGNLSLSGKFPVPVVICLGGLEPLHWLSRSCMTLYKLLESFLASFKTHNMSGPEKMTQAFGSAPVHFT